MSWTPNGVHSICFNASQDAVGFLNRWADGSFHLKLRNHHI